MSFWRSFSRRLLAKEATVGDAPEREAPGLRSSLTRLDLLVIGVAQIIGAGIFVISGVGIKIAGPGLMLSLLVAGPACTLAALCYAELASMMPRAGSAYTYAYAIFGEISAWIIGWDLILEYGMGAATVAAGWSFYLRTCCAPTAGPSPLGLRPAYAPARVINLPAAGIVLISRCCWSSAPA